MHRRGIVPLLIVLSAALPLRPLAEDWNAEFDWRGAGLARFGTEDAVTGKVVLSAHGDLPGATPAPWGAPLRGGWRVTLLPDRPGPAGTTLEWAIPNVGTFASAVADGATGAIDVTFPKLGRFPVTLTTHRPDGATASHTADVVVKDYLIVSIGDSVASGEGNPPDETGDQDAYYQSDLAADPAYGTATDPAKVRAYYEYRSSCHRTIHSGTSQAAARIPDEIDPRSSVTFVHLACTGATTVEGLWGSQGGRVPQLDQLREIVGTRRIDALLVSIGGNDIGFADIVMECGVTDLAWQALGLPIRCNVPMPSWTGIRTAANRFEDALPEFGNRLQTLNGQLAGLYGTVAEQGGPMLQPNRVYVSEYFDPTRYDSHIAEWLGGGMKYCGQRPAWWVPAENWTFWLPAMTADKNRWASRTVVQGLNDALAGAAGATGWEYVGGIADDFREGHGFCAYDLLGFDDRWVVTIFESLGRQGDQNGTLHPTRRGHATIADHLVEHVGPDLLNPSPSPLMLLSTQSAKLGRDGWYVGRCDAVSGCTSDAATLAVHASAADGIDASVPMTLALDGLPILYGPGFCSTGRSDVTCAYEEIAEPGTIRDASWTLTFVEDGVHQLVGTALERGAALPATAAFAVKVDLHDPTMAVSIPPEQEGLVVGDAGWFRSRVLVSFLPSDAPGGSGVEDFEAFDGDLPIVLDTTETAAFYAVLGADGVHPLTASAVDDAGRKSAPQSVTVKIDATAPTLAGAPDRLPNDRGWYNADVTVTFQGADATSGIAFLTPPAVLHEGANQTVAGTARDVAGNVTQLVLGPVSIDETPPTVQLVSASDGAFTLEAGALDVAFLTNAPALAVTFQAFDALSGMWSLLLDGAPIPLASTSAALSLAPGVTTHALRAEDVAGNVAAAQLSAVYAPLTAPPDGARLADPRFWRTAVGEGVLTEAELSELLARVNAVSRVFGGPLARYPELTLANYRGFLTVSAIPESLDDYETPLPDPEPPGAPGYEALDRHARAELVAAWLDLVSGYVPTTLPVDVPPSSAGALHGRSATALEATWQAELSLAASGDPRDVVEAMTLLRAVLNAAARQ